jgi:Zn-dependent protease
VPVNRRNLRRPRDHGTLVSLAGPATNILLAVGAAVLLRSGVGDGGVVTEGLFRFGVVNVVLAAFNLLPIPPLDGSSVVERFLPRRFLRGWSKLRQYAMPLVLGVVLLFPRALGTVFGWATDLWRQLL